MFLQSNTVGRAHRRLGGVRRRTSSYRGSEVPPAVYRTWMLAIACMLAGCGGGPPPAPSFPVPEAEWQIGPGDSVNIFVWRNPELSTTVPVRPDGKISIPLVEDIVAAGRTPAVLARDVEQ